MARFLRLATFTTQYFDTDWYVSDDEYTWNQSPVGTTTAMPISGEGRIHTPEAAGTYYAFPQTPAMADPDYDVHFAVKVFSLQPSAPCGALAHWGDWFDPSSTGYTLQHTGSGQTLELLRSGAGVLWSAPLVASAGGLFSVLWKIRETASSVDHEIWADGALLGSHSDTDAGRITGGGRVGVKNHDAAGETGSHITYLSVTSAAVADGPPDAATPPAAVTLAMSQESQSTHIGTLSGGTGRTRWELHRGPDGFTPDRDTFDTLVAVADDASVTTARAWTRAAYGATEYYRAVAVNDAGTATSAQVAITHAAVTFPPTFSRLNAGQPLFTHTSVSSPSLYWVSVHTSAEILTLLGKKYMWLWSTDHHGGAGGLYMATSSDLLCTDLTVLGVFWDANDAGGNWTQVETPHYVYNPDDANGRPHYVYHQAADLVAGVQSSRLITSADLVTWVDEGTVLPNTAEKVHTGYIKAFRSGTGDWNATHLTRGGLNPRWAWSTSTDGKTWDEVRQVHGGKFVYRNTAEIGAGPQSEGFDYGGHRWMVGSSGVQDAGTGGTAGDIISMQEVVGFHELVGEGVEALLPSLGTSGVFEETSSVRGYSIFQEGTDVYLIYATNAPETGGNGEPWAAFIAQLDGSAEPPPDPEPEPEPEPTPSTVAAMRWDVYGLDVTFHDETADVVSRLWTFEDHGTSTASDPVVSFSAVGSYAITLEVTDSAGTESSVTRTLVLASDTGQTVATQVLVEDADGAWQDLMTLGGTCWVNSVDWGASVDQVVQSATIQLWGGTPDGSLAPLMTGSTYNTKADGTYGPLLNPGRGVKIRTNTDDAGFVTVFHGLQREVESGRRATLHCLDLGKLLQDTWIETETNYGAVDGVAVQDVMQSILDDNLGVGVVTLVTPVDPGFRILPYTQAKTSVMEALQTLALQIGWEVRYRYDASTDTWELRFSEPDRAKTTPDHTFAPAEILTVRRLSLSDSNIRNRVRVVYTDSATGTRTSTTVEDAASILEFGPRFMEIAESSSSQIDTGEEATTMATAAVSDLSLPISDQEVEVHYWSGAEVGDLYRFSPNGIHYDTAQDLAVIGYRHSITRGQQRTYITTRGTPAGAYRAWLLREAGIVVEDGEDGSDADSKPQIMRVSVSETDSLGTLTLTPVEGAVFDTVETRIREGNDAWTPWSAETADGSGNYVESVALTRKHNSRIAYRVSLDGVVIEEDLATFDVGGLANVVSWSVSYEGGTASVRVQFDTDVAVGAGNAEFSTNGGGSWTPDEVSANQRCLFDVAQSTTAKINLLVRGYNVAGLAGPEAAIDISPFEPASIEDNSIAPAKLVESAQKFGSTVTFTATDHNTVSWSSGTITLQDGTAYAISAGNTGNMAAETYVYLAPATSTTVLQTTTSIVTATQVGSIFIAVLVPASDTDWLAGVFPAVGVLSLNGDNISPKSIKTDHMDANSVTAVQLAALALEVGKYIRSTTYSAGSAGWSIEADGSAEFQNVTVRGTIEAGSTIAASNFTGTSARFTGAGPGGESAALYIGNADALGERELRLHDGGLGLVENDGSAFGFSVISLQTQPGDSGGVTAGNDLHLTAHGGGVIDGNIYLNYGLENGADSTFDTQTIMDTGLRVLGQNSIATFDRDYFRIHNANTIATDETVAELRMNIGGTQVQRRVKVGASGTAGALKRALYVDD